jgi:DNA repair protein RecN (Recombination protein N)
MLAQLTIHNFALIDRLELAFEEGFNVLTGETGAGKSILIDAISVVLGERAGVEMVRTGAEKALIEAAFQLSPAQSEALADWAEEGLLVLGRELSRSGRSQCRINGRLCTASALREVAAHLVDLHGQHEHQSLLSPEKHVELLEIWAGEPLQAPTRRARALYAELQATRRELAALQTDERERARRLDLYQFQIDEIDAAEPVPGEEEELQADRTRLANAEKLSAAAGAALVALHEADGDPGVAAVDLLAVAARELEAIAALDESLTPALESAQSALYAAQDAARTLRAYQEGIEFNPSRLESVQERLELLRTLKRKYGETLEEVLAYRERTARELEALAHGEERAAELEARLQGIARELDETAAALYAARQDAARRFEAALVAELRDLSMANTIFEVRVDPPQPAAADAERGLAAILGRVEFLISPNPGEPVKPLARIASGGEISRIMLALKSATAVRGAAEGNAHPRAPDPSPHPPPRNGEGELDVCVASVGGPDTPLRFGEGLGEGSAVPTLIFDEIDVGVGGRTAEVLGEKMAALACSSQVLCVTHLPQIASLATAHFSVGKSVVGERTVVEVRRLTGEERVEEVARMLGGAAATAEQHAREMIYGRGRTPRRADGEPTATPTADEVARVGRRRPRAAAARGA